jgi:uncharacterized membrane protein YciS (DUF1049 family)
MARTFALALLLFVFFAFVSALFASVNSQVVTVNFLIFEGEQAISLWLFAAFVAGGLISMLICTLIIVKLSLSNKKLQKKLTKIQRSDQALMSQMPQTTL